MNDFKRVAIVTGVSCGLGFAACRQLATRGLKVVLTSREDKSGRAAASG